MAEEIIQLPEEKYQELLKLVDDLSKKRPDLIPKLQEGLKRVKPYKYIPEVSFTQSVKGLGELGKQLAKGAVETIKSINIPPAEELLKIASPPDSSTVDLGLVTKFIDPTPLIQPIAGDKPDPLIGVKFIGLGGLIQAIQDNPPKTLEDWKTLLSEYSSNLKNPLYLAAEIPPGFGGVLGGATAIAGRRAAGKALSTMKKALPESAETLWEKVMTSPEKSQVWNKVAPTIQEKVEQTIATQNKTPILVESDVRRILKAVDESPENLEKINSVVDTAIERGLARYDEAVVEAAKKKIPVEAVVEGRRPKLNISNVSTMLASKFTDINAPLREFEKQLALTGRYFGPITEGPYLKAFQAHASMIEGAARAELEFLEPFRKAVQEVAEKYNIKPELVLDHLARYATALHVPVRNALFQFPGVHPFDTKGSGFSIVQANKLHRSVEEFAKSRGIDPKAYISDLEAIRANHVAKISDEALKFTSKALDNPSYFWTSKAKFGPTYITLKGRGPSFKRFPKNLDELQTFFDPYLESHEIGEKLKQRLSAPAVRMARGRVFPVGENPIYMTVWNLLQSQRMAEKNIFARSLYRIAEKLNNPNIMKIITPDDLKARVGAEKALKPEEIRVYIKGKEHRIAFGTPYIDLAKAIKTFGVSDIISTAIPIGDWLAKAIRSFRPLASTKTGRRLANKLEGLSPDPLTKITSSMARNLTAHDPLFPIRNFIQDVQYALTYMLGSFKGKQVAKDFSKNLLLATTFRKRPIKSGYFKGKTWAEVYQHAKENGLVSGLSSLIGSELSLNPELALRAKGPGMVTRAINNACDRMNEFAEALTKVSMYKSMVDNGIDPKLAAHFASSYGVNFIKRGELSKLLNKIWLFSSVNIQTGVRWMKEFLLNPRYRGVLYDLTAFSFGYHTALRFFGGVDPLTGDSPLDRQSEYEKLRYISYPSINYETGDVYFRRFYAGFGPVAFFWYLGRFLSDTIFSKGTLTQESLYGRVLMLLGGFIQSFTPFAFARPTTNPIEPPIVIETFMNIAKPDRPGWTASTAAGEIPAAKGSQEASLWKLISDSWRTIVYELLPGAPIRLKESLYPSATQVKNFFISPLFSGTYRNIFDFLDYLIRELSGNPTERKPGPLGYFTKSAGDYATVSRLFWEAASKIKKSKSERTSLKKVDPGRDYEFAYEEWPLRQAEERLDAVLAVLQEYYKNLHNKDLTPEEQKNLFDSIYLAQARFLESLHTIPGISSEGVLPRIRAFLGIQPKQIAMPPRVQRIVTPPDQPRSHIALP